MLLAFAYTINVSRLDVYDFFSAWYQKGVALTMLGRFDEAIDTYSEAQRLCSGEPSVAFNLGSVLMERERYEEALVQFKAAKQLGHPRAANRLKLVKERRGTTS